MAGKPGHSEVVTVDAHELRALIQRLKTVEDRKLKASMRKALKASADLAVEGVQHEVLRSVPARMKAGGRTRSTGLRSDIARATRASLLAGSDKGGGQVKIVTADARLSARHKSMGLGYNSRVFRHPVFADQTKTRDKWRWVEQRGQGNYFGRGVYGKRRDMLARLQAAMDDVAKQITG